jgi:hypothetical protein
LFVAKALVVNVKTITLFGAPYKNADLKFKDGIGIIEIIFSFGSIQNKGYSCHYLGNSKIMETTKFAESEKIFISITVL